MEEGLFSRVVEHVGKELVVLDGCGDDFAAKIEGSFLKIVKSYLKCKMYVNVMKQRGYGNRKKQATPSVFSADNTQGPP